MTTTCPSVRSALIDYAADCLAPLEAGRVSDHLRVCDACRSRVAELSATIESIAGHEPPALTPTRRDAMRATLRVAAARAEAVHHGALQVAAFSVAVVAAGVGAWGVFHADWLEALGGPWVLAGATGIAAIISAGLVPALRRTRREGGN